jgi:hypothetical protein
MNGISGVTQDEDFVIDHLSMAECGMEKIDDVFFQPAEIAVFKLAVYVARKVIMRHVLRRRGCRVPQVDRGWLVLAQEFIRVFAPETNVLLSSPKPIPHSTRRMSNE